MRGRLFLDRKTRLEMCREPGLGKVSVVVIDGRRFFSCLAAGFNLVLRIKALMGCRGAAQSNWLGL